jgi:hypothetical protein
MVRIRLVIVGAVMLSCLTACAFNGPITVRTPGCINAHGNAGSAGDEIVVAVAADACRATDGSLLPEVQAFDLLGRSAWRAPGPPIDGLVITIGRSAERPVGDQPRSLPLTSQQATQRWGVHPVVQADQDQRGLVRFLGSFALIAVALIVVVLGAGLFLALVGCLRRGEIVLVWFLR